MRTHGILLGASKRRLERLAAELAEERVPWILSQVAPRIGAVERSGWRGYARAWAGVAIEGCITAKRLSGLDNVERRTVLRQAVELAAEEVLRGAAVWKHRSRRKAA
jgi:hypothetical protein